MRTLLLMFGLIIQQSWAEPQPRVLGDLYLNACEAYLRTDQTGRHHYISESKKQPEINLRLKSPPDFAAFSHPGKVVRYANLIFLFMSEEPELAILDLKGHLLLRIHNAQYPDIPIIPLAVWLHDVAEKNKRARGRVKQVRVYGETSLAFEVDGLDRILVLAEFGPGPTEIKTLGLNNGVFTTQLLKAVKLDDNAVHAIFLRRRWRGFGFSRFENVGETFRVDKSVDKSLCRDAGSA